MLPQTKRILIPNHEDFQKIIFFKITEHDSGFLNQSYVISKSLQSSCT